MAFYLVTAGLSVVYLGGCGFAWFVFLPEVFRETKSRAGRALAAMLMVGVTMAGTGFVAGLWSLAVRLAAADWA